MSISKLFYIRYINDYVSSYILIFLFGIKIKKKYYVCKKHGSAKNHLTFINFSAVKNLGDIYSSPVNYFNFKNYIQYDYLYALNKKIDVDKVAIVGGGVYLSQFLKSIRAKYLIGWGIGFFKEDNIDTTIFRLLGTREYNFKGIDNKTAHV